MFDSGISSRSTPLSYTQSPENSVPVCSSHNPISPGVCPGRWRTGGGDGRPFEELVELLAERSDPETGVDEKVPFAPANQVHVPAQERVDVRLDDADHAVVDRLVVEPTVGDAHRAGS